MNRAEQEVIVNFNAQDETAEIYASDPAWIRKFDKLLENNPEQFKAGQSETLEGKVVAKRYSFPKRFLSIRSKDTKRKPMTDEQRREASERMKELRKQQLS